MANSYILQFWNLRRPTIWLEHSNWTIEGSLLAVSSHGPRGIEEGNSLMFLLIRALILFMSAPSSGLNFISRAAPPTAFTLGIRYQHEYWGTQTFGPQHWSQIYLLLMLCYCCCQECKPGEMMAGDKMIVCWEFCLWPVINYKKYYWLSTKKCIFSILLMKHYINVQKKNRISVEFVSFQLFRNIFRITGVDWL